MKVRSTLLIGAAAVLAAPAAAQAGTTPAKPAPAPTKPAPKPAPKVAPVAGVGTTQFFSVAFAATTKQGQTSTVDATGAFEFKFKSGLKIKAKATCLRAEGTKATIGGVITSSANTAELEGAADPGQYVEFSIEDVKKGNDLTSSLSFVGSDPAGCVTDYDLDLSTKSCNTYTVVDRYVPVLPEPPVEEPVPTETTAPAV